MTTVTVNAATQDDIGSLIASVAGLFLEDADRHDSLMDVDWPEREGAAYYSALINDEACLVALACDGGHVIGHLVGKLSGPDSLRAGRVAVLESMRVAPASRGAGVGGLLVRTSSPGPAIAARNRPALPPTLPTTQRSAFTHGTASCPRASPYGPFFNVRSCRETSESLRGRPSRWPGIATSLSSAQGGQGLRAVQSGAVTVRSELRR